MSEQVTLDSEEDAKIHLVVAYLQEAGFTADELEYETSFSIQVGHYIYRVESKDTEKATKKASGRSDILVRRGGKPILIVEVKAADLELTDGDRDQAVSYARLHDPMVPVAAVTNGKEFRLYDVITKDRIESTALEEATGRTLSTDLDAKVEALEMFLGYTEANLRWFCSQQVARGTALYTSALADEWPHYLPSAYVEPRSLRAAFSAFLAQKDRRVFVVSGQAGSGKSAWCVHRALASDGPCLFVRSSEIVKGLIPKLARELAWTLTPSLAADTAAQRFARILRGVPFLLFVDAVDEVDADDISDALDEVLQLFPANVRLVVACKTSRLDQVGSKPGGLTARWVLDSGSRGGHDASEIGDAELFAMIRGLDECLGRRLAVAETVLRDARSNPGLLRTAYDVARASGDNFAGYNSKKFFSSYVDKRVARFGDQRITARAALARLARASFDRREALIPLHDGLECFRNEELFHRAIDLRFIETTVSASSGETVRFVESRIRDYLALESLGWLTADPSALSGNSAFAAATEGVQLDVLELFFLLADADRRRIIHGSTQHGAERVVTLMDSCAGLLAQELASRFRPPMNARDLVLYYSIPRREALAAAWVPRGQLSERVFYWPRGRAVLDDDTAFVLGASTVHAVWRQALETDSGQSDFVFWRSFATSLIKGLRSGLFSDSNSPILTNEKAGALAVALRCVESSRLWPVAARTPLSEVRANVVRRRATEVYIERHARFEERDLGHVTVRTWDRSTVDFAAARSFADETARQPEASLLKLQHEPTRESMLDEELWRCLELLEAMGRTHLEPSIPAPDAVGPMVWHLWTDAASLELAVCFGNALLEGIPAIVSENLTGVLATVTVKPLTDLRLVVSAPREESLVFVRLRDPNGRLPPVSTGEVGRRMVRDVTFDGESFESIGWTSTSKSSLVTPRHSYLPERWGIRSNAVPLRAYVYSALEDLLVDALRELAPDYGAEAKTHFNVM